MFRLKEGVGRLLRLSCGAYGGTMPDGRSRWCNKWRWHTDSHTYVFDDESHTSATEEP